MKLQWGRNLTVAEGAPACERTAQYRALQWGRNLTVAEGSAFASVRNKHLNELQWGRNLTVAEGITATALPCSSRTLLQWGRNLTVAEGEAARRKARLAEAASMGPQLDSCGREWVGVGCAV